MSDGCGYGSCLAGRRNQVAQGGIQDAVPVHLHRPIAIETGEVQGLVSECAGGDTIAAHRETSVVVVRVRGVAPARREVKLVFRTGTRSEEHTSELQSLRHLVCRLLLEKQLILV